MTVTRMQAPWWIREVLGTYRDCGRPHMLTCWLGKILNYRRPLVGLQRGIRVHAQGTRHMSDVVGMRLPGACALDEQFDSHSLAESGAFVGCDHSPEFASASHPGDRGCAPTLLAGLGVANQRADRSPGGGSGTAGNQGPVGAPEAAHRSFAPTAGVGAAPVCPRATAARARRAQSRTPD